MPFEGIKLGVLALQGAFEKHAEICPVPTRHVRYPVELQSCDGLIIPGGESTTIWKQMEELDFITAIKEFEGPIFGTCAGLIILVKLGLLDVIVERNGYGRQINSFLTSLDFKGKPIAALFIRAPRIKSTAPSVQVLSTYEGEPVVVQQGRFFASTFHPELTQEVALHNHFLEMCREN